MSDTLLKTCCECKKSLTLDNFYLQKKSKDGLQNKCKICHKIYRNKHYVDNKQKYIDKAKLRNNKVKKWWKEYKKQFSCCRCGESHPACIQFHHKNSDKVAGVSQLARFGKKETILLEISKCEVLCANCHFKEHWIE